MTQKTEVDYRQTVNLPQTAFPQRGNLAKREPEVLQRWREMDLDQRLDERRDRKEYVLHDGPPYANGNIHIGHALNKILKDVVVRYKSMSGHRVHYVPGWDCHGLPIEQKVVEKMQEEGRYEKATPLEIRKECQEYAAKWVDIQREQFIRLGGTGDWFHPYLTMSPTYEIAVLSALKDLVEKGLVYKGLKSVQWDPVFETALADAEIEYKEDHVSPSIYVRFPLKSTPKIESLQGGNAAIVIWTTTPWTLPANLAVALHPDLTYVSYKVNNEVLVIVEDLLEDFQEKTGLNGGEVFERFKGGELEKEICEHPLLDKDSLVVLGDHVTVEQGTGCVHTAPGHGEEDFQIGVEYGLDIFNPVNEKGQYTSQYPEMEGVNVFDANPKIVEKLKQNGRLIHVGKVTHSYPYSWRSRKPVIVRATEQWFMDVDKDGLRKATLEEADKVHWIPGWGRDRIANMFKSRPHWCLSRQRSWGIPIPSVLDKETGHSHLRVEVIDKLIEFVKEETTDAWFTRPVEDFLPEEMQGADGRYEKEYNTLDVWFDSGGSHLAVLNEHNDLTWPADLYLEGSDQHRGWFQHSMWIAMGVKGQAPYRAVLTHGFVLDEKGEAMSKSVGNVVSPIDVVALRGADVLRLWVSSEDYRADVSISRSALELPKKKSREDWGPASTYRRIRNTLRFLLGNLFDFNPMSNSVPYSEMTEEDRWLLHELNQLNRTVSDAFEKFEFHRVYHAINGFCVTELGSLYLDMLKDRLYCSAPDDTIRRSSQSAMYETVERLTRMIAPFLVFTADEAWENLPAMVGRAPSVHLADFPAPVDEWDDPQLAEKWERLLTLRSEVTRAIEPLRAKENKVIGNSLDALVTLRSRDPESNGFLRSELDRLPTLFIVSQVELAQEEAGEVPEELKAVGLHVSVKVEKAKGEKCSRCWKWSEETGQDEKHPTLCGRCADVIRRTYDAS